MEEKHKHPCKDCRYRINEAGEECNIMCGKWKKWFKEEWRRVTEPFREVAKQRDYRKTHERYVYK